MYDWDTAYVSQILHNPVYTGNLVVADKPTKTMRSKKRQYIPYAEREIIYGTHEPVIEQSRWNTVQKILQSRPPVIRESPSGYDNIFRGIIKCADCGSAMLAKAGHKRKCNNVLDKTFYCCTKYRKSGKEGCSSHTIEAGMVHEVVLADIQKHAGQALADRKAMVTEIAEQISGYAGITEFNFKIINQLIEKILVSEPVETDGQKIQRLTIHYKFIGALEPLE